MLELKSIVATTVAGIWLAATAIQAQEITLRSIDESFTMSGTLAGFDGQNYQLESSVGTLLLGVDAVTCEGAACPDLLIDIQEFTIAGSKTMGTQMMPLLIEAYAFSLGADLETEIISDSRVIYSILDSAGEIYAAITLDLGSSADAFTALENGDAFIGLSSRRVTESERNRFLRAGKGDLTSAAQERILGLDGLAIALNPANPVQSLSLEQISDIFAGNILNWREVGGLDLPISIYRQNGSAGSTQVFDTLVMAPSRRSLSNIAFILDDSDAIADAVMNDRNGIGIISVANDPNANTVALRSICGQITTPTDFSIKTEEYPMSRRLFAYVNGRKLPEKVAGLLDFITSDAAQEVVVRAGFANQAVTTASLNDQGRRLAHALIAERDRPSLELLQELVASIQDAERMSLTFRFKSGSVAPDNRAERDIIRLAEMLRQGAFDGKRLLIIGFADNIGAINENQRLSQARAESVRDTLLETVGTANIGNVQFTPVGYGKLSPIGCNETEDGRDTNRRVEIWVR